MSLKHRQTGPTLAGRAPELFPNREKLRRFSAGALAGSALAALGRDQRGVSAVEFALVSPVLMLLIAGAVDLGGAIYTKFQLDCAVNAAIDYAMVNAASVNSTAGPALASTMAALVANAQGASTASASITVNAGPTASIGAGAGAGGAASAANSCYCPSGTAPAVSWGSAATCGAACSGGGFAGKFVLVQASTAYAPIFSGFGFMQSGQITSSSIVRVQ
jgi:Flp pilus assembly protein TadG